MLSIQCLPKYSSFKETYLTYSRKQVKKVPYAYFSKLVQTVSTKQDFDICCLFLNYGIICCLKEVEIVFYSLMFYLITFPLLYGNKNS